MAYQQPAVFRPPQPQLQQTQQLHQNDALRSQESSSIHLQLSSQIEQSQEWVLFAPSLVDSSTDRTRTSKTAGLSRVSDLGSLSLAGRSAQPTSSALDDEVTEDGELDSLDDGLHEFREPPVYRTSTNQLNAPVLPAHDGLGTFTPSSTLVLEQLWRHERHNPKRKHDGHHRRASSIQRRLETVEEAEVHANEEKRIRIERWRMDQSQAFLEDLERETRRQMKMQSMQSGDSRSNNSILTSTSRQADLGLDSGSQDGDAEPFWRKITRTFIRDIIGIDEPLLSVILGESLPGEWTPRPSSPTVTPNELEATEERNSSNTWRSRLLQRIAKELGVFVHQLSPHPGAFSTYLSDTTTSDYAGIPIRRSAKPIIETHALTRERTDVEFSSALTPNFPPTLRDPVHAESWGFEDEPADSSNTATLNLREERQYWERELDVKMVFRYLANKFVGAGPAPAPREEVQARQKNHHDSSATRAAIIRQHHPLIARTNRSPASYRRDSRVVRKAASSCASESVKSGHKANVLRSGSSRNYWDLGGSAGSGSLMASGGLMGAWGET